MNGKNSTIQEENRRVDILRHFGRAALPARRRSFGGRRRFWRITHRLNANGRLKACSEPSRTLHLKWQARPEQTCRILDVAEDLPYLNRGSGLQCLAQLLPFGHAALQFGSRGT